MDTKALRQKILDLAIHGKLVPQDPNDEPASVLLERIKAEKERLIKEGKIKRSKKSAKSSDTPHYPYLLPNGWEWCNLEDIVSFGGGKTPSMDNKEYWDNGNHLWVTSKDMKYSYITNSLMKITDKALEVMTIYEKGTLLVVTRSGILRHTLPLSILEKPATVNQDLKTISPHIQELSEYLYVVIKANEHFILKEYHKDGTTVDSIDFDKFRCLPIPLAPIAEQKRIIVETKRWFALIDQVEQGKVDLQTTIKQAKSKILGLAIHGKLVPQDLNDEPAIELLKRINPDFTPCDNGHYTQLPEGWAICKMKQITSITNGKSQKNVETLNGIYPIYGSGGVIGRANQYLCIAGSTIIGRKGTINNPIFVEEHFWNVDTAFGLKANDAILDKYLYYFCLSFDFSKLDKSTAMPSLTKTSIGNVLIPIPPYKEQERIVAKIDMVLDTMNEILRAV
ncbi:restriction endonuclease subunit S [Phocaeicola dorei]|uniref:restriction endonuclease subunit S n=1 Tax=Phocaeicola TaxID=909656 RepID=UPI0012302C68|nr:restriction endonuclease subunit S [Phocaeicola dorei]KAA5291037.1 restriction endonuclease subunit S [Phocaeicola dorei]KAA5322740.1 restriction endonuclease subunit S [Phocaeicola dorei]KAA5342071.1 restriction endonuclease subunit S [Phocaeicola dorei]KAA5347798.1 restriction endonuclease subunit S [Phocaeicola dorei]KAA5365957.1 restriction endonuclease subunit S [Phocaeicola dorei]